MMGKKQDREQEFLVGIPDTGRDHLQDADVQRRTQLFHCMTSCTAGLLALTSRLAVF
jgi:hypothetical protein